MAFENKYRFSTKRADDATDSVHYEYRIYRPSSGTWLSRDPIQEQGGLNLFAFVGNNPLFYFDFLGLDVTQTIKDESGNIVAYTYDSPQNCAGYALGLTCVAPVGKTTWKKVMDALGFKCTEGVSAQDCKKHCNCKNYIELYLYLTKRVKDPDGVKKRFPDPFNTPWDDLKNADIDFHALKGEDDGTFTLQPGRTPLGTPPLPYPDQDHKWPDYFPANRILTKACCCKK
jgi:RHS repeat-associated protein